MIMFDYCVKVIIIANCGYYLLCMFMLPLTWCHHVKVSAFKIA